ncbi:DNA-binding transcriptional regulator [uncultured Streptomyces sp.]|uniref:helix-turn-helix domain-containing protein n=1 Tax=uncultured Streptomyces sp. TaxID=174707 RepID=UPI00260D5456|nr:helix-turn-helix transcriptional regulator [uncultured Streptomyces sp.]
MAADSRRPSRPALTGSTGRPREGVITGYLFKTVREQIPLTQPGLAEALGVDSTTIQGWESGRRPLTATRAGTLRSITRKLIQLGAPAEVLRLLDEAVDADAIVSHAMSGPPTNRMSDHPLSGWVFTRNTTHLLAWALNGTPPAALPAQPARRRHGPTASSPLLPADERAAFFAHMRRAAELADQAGVSGALLRRQALYLSSYDRATDTHRWLADMRKTTHHPKGWTLHWADTRSLAASLTRHGDNEPMQAFIRHGMGTETGEIANLNYWAYWLGIDRIPRSDDTFMVDTTGGHWDGLTLLRGLTNRLTPGLGCIDLNAHSVWALLTARRGLLAADPSLNTELSTRVSALLDGNSISAQTRRELEAVHYGLNLHT